MPKEVTIQGDILYALGEVGDLHTQTWIAQTITTLTHQDLIDAAKEALASIETR